MNNDLNNMAKRYKDEMMRLYHQSGASGKKQQSSGIMGMGSGMSGNAVNAQMSKSATDRMAVQAQDYAQANGCQTAMTGTAANMQRNAAGTPAANVPGASFYNSSGMNGDMSGQNVSNGNMNGSGNMNGNMDNIDGNMQVSGCSGGSVTVPINVPVECECRFPTAESIIDSINSGNALVEPLGGQGNMNRPALYNSNAAANGMNTMNTMNTMSDTANMANMTNMTRSAQTMPAADPVSVQSLSAQNMNAQNLSAQTLSNDLGSILSSFIINAFPTNVDYAANDQNENTREVLPDFALPADLPADAEGEIPQTRHFSPSVGWITITGDNSWGFFQAEVFDANGDPIQGALVIVRKLVNNSERLTRLLFTNRNGFTPTIALPAPLAINTGWNSTTPFSTYEITVRAQGYYTMRNIQIPMYAGSKIRQPIEMTRIYQNNRPIQPRSDDAVG